MLLLLMRIYSTRLNAASATHHARRAYTAQCSQLSIACSAARPCKYIVPSFCARHTRHASNVINSHFQIAKRGRGAIASGFVIRGRSEMVGTHVRRFDVMHLSLLSWATLRSSGDTYARTHQRRSRSDGPRQTSPVLKVLYLSR